MPKWLRQLAKVSGPAVLVLFAGRFASAQMRLDGQPDVVDRAIEDQDPLAVSTRYMAANLNAAGQMTRMLYPGSPLGDPAYIYRDPATGLNGRVRNYKLQGQGFTAYLNRPIYIVRKEAWEKEGKKPTYTTQRTPRDDGQWISLIPPDTVYDLNPRPAITPEQVMAYAAVDQLQSQQPPQGQTNDEVGNIPSNPFYVPRSPNQVEARVDGQIYPQMINNQIDPRQQTSMYVESGPPTSTFAVALEQQAQMDQSNADRLFEARKGKWLAMKRELAEERRAKRADAAAPTPAAGQSAQAISERLEAIRAEIAAEKKSAEPSDPPAGE